MPCPGRRFAFPALLILLYCFAAASVSAQKRGPSTALAHPRFGPAPVESTEPMPLVAPVFLQTAQIDSSVSIVNGTELPAPGFVTVRDMSGAAVIRKPITFAAHSSQVIAAHDLLNEAGSVIQSGSMTVEQAPTVKGPALLGQLSMTLHVGSVPAFLEEELGMPTMHGSQSLRGVSSETTNLPLVAVTSNSESAQTITASCVGEGTPSKIELAAGATAVVRVCSWEQMRDSDLGLASALLQSEKSESKNHAVQLTTDAAPGSFYAFGFSLNGKITNAQLQPLDFYDPGMAFSTSTIYVGVPLGTGKLLRNSSYTPTVTLANFSAQPRTAEVLLADSSSGAPKVTSIAQTSIPAYSTKTLRLSGATGSGVQNSITVKADGQPGDVQVHLFAGEAGTERRVEMLAKDAKDNHNGGNHPWSIANGDESTLLLHNPTATQQIFEVQISSGPAKWKEVYTLAPSETKAVSINNLIQQETKDHTGRTLPKTIGSGEVQWFTSVGASGVGRLLVSNQGSALARNYSCTTYYNMCSATFGSNNFLDTVYDTDAFYSAIVPTVCTEYSPNSCYQNQPVSTYLSYSTQFQGDYSNLNNTINAYPSQLNLHSTGIGSFSISALVNAGSCQVGPLGGGGTIAPSVSISGPTFIGAGSVKTYTLTATGKPTGGTFAWSLANGNATLSSTSSASVNIEGVSGGTDTVSVTYTVGGMTVQSTQSENVVLPNHLYVAGDSTGTISSAGGNSVQRQIIYAILANNVPITDAVYMNEDVPRTTDSCGQSVVTGNAGFRTDKVTPYNGSQFTDFIGDPPDPNGGSCSYSFSNQSWSLELGNGNLVRVATIGTIQASTNAVLVNGQASTTQTKTY